jgi:quinoprotein glucose dehydrogenase
MPESVSSQINAGGRARIAAWTFAAFAVCVVFLNAGPPGQPVEDAGARSALPQFKVIPAAKVSELSPSSGKAFDRDYRDWPRSHGDATSSRYSGLSQVNTANVRKLAIAWTYRSKDGAGNIQANPVIVDGVVYAPTVGNCVVALNAENGQELWRFKPEGRPAMRGLTFWAGTDGHESRLLFTAGEYLYAVSAKTGQPVASFGNHGRTAAGGVVAPGVFKHVVVVPVWNIVKGFDLFSGKLLWEFHLIEGAAGVASGRLDKGANAWGGMALDTERGIAYVATGSPHPNFVGIDQKQDHPYANAVVALDALTGKYIWHFQEIRRDIWDLDLAAPPNLVTVVRNGRRYDAVAQVSKMGNTLLLDRRSGKPLFPFRLRRAPTSSLPGERTAPYQPALLLPEPFARQKFSVDDVSDISDEGRRSVLEQLRDGRFGFFEPFEEGKPTVFYGIYGGAEWTGAAFDPNTQHLYVSSNELAAIVTVGKFPRRDPNAPPTPGMVTYRKYCAACHAPNRGGAGGAPSLNGLSQRFNDQRVTHVMQRGVNTMPPVPVPDTERRALLDYLFDRDVVATPGIEVGYSSNGFPKLYDSEGYPGTKPPWGTLNAINLNTGKITWRVPLGEYPELTARGIPKTGTVNFGGPMVTAGGLVFCAGTRDRKIRAFDRGSGAELWSHTLPLGGYAPPATYEVNGRQYILIAATGGGKQGGKTGDAYVAFALR